MYVVVKKTGTTFSNVGDPSPNISTFPKADDGAFLDVIEVTDYHEKMTAEYHIVYYVYEGKVRLLINGQEIILEKGDSIYIEKGTFYEMQGTFKAMAVDKS